MESLLASSRTCIASDQTSSLWRVSSYLQRWKRRSVRLSGSRRVCEGCPVPPVDSLVCAWVVWSKSKSKSLSSSISPRLLARSLLPPAGDAQESNSIPRVVDVTRGRSYGTVDASGAGHLHVLKGEEYPDWEAVYRDNLTGIYRYVYGRVGNRPDAEDLTGEIFTATLHRLRLPSPRERVRAYLVQTARTVLADHWRRWYGHPHPGALDDDASNLPEVTLNEDASARAERILARLPANFRRILELRFLRGYSVREAAREMGVSEGNARVLQLRALRYAAGVGWRELP